MSIFSNELKPRLLIVYERLLVLLRALQTQFCVDLAQPLEFLCPGHRLPQGRGCQGLSPDGAGTGRRLSDRTCLSHVIQSSRTIASTPGKLTVEAVDWSNR